MEEEQDGPENKRNALSVSQDVNLVSNGPENTRNASNQENVQRVISGAKLLGNVSRTAQLVKPLTEKL